MKGAVTSYIDVAQIMIWLFWIFFAGLVYYLLREGKREGFPLETGRPGLLQGTTFPDMPGPKTYLLPGGGSVSVPNGKVDTRILKAVDAERWPGSPIVPTGDPMMDGVGPAAYAERADVPDQIHGKPRIVPLRAAPAFSLAAGDPDPRGMTVIGADGESGGTVRDVWVDVCEYIIRYLEVDVAGQTDGRRALLPMNFARIDAKRKRVNVKSVLGAHFAKVPALQNADQVTLREEDRITGYFGGGHLYATAKRREPML